jgi:hypothetical protein
VVRDWLWSGRQSSSSCERRTWLAGRKIGHTLDGGLDLADGEGRRVEHSPGTRFGLAVFLRWPGVRPVLTETERERQWREESDT